MAYTDVGSTAGVVYDVNEENRLNDLANKFNSSAENAEKTDSAQKNVLRYGIIVFSTVLIVALLRIAVKNKKK